MFCDYQNSIKETTVLLYYTRNNWKHSAM